MGMRLISKIHEIDGREYTLRLMQELIIELQKREKYENKSSKEYFESEFEWIWQ